MNTVVVVTAVKTEEQIGPTCFPRVTIDCKCVQRGAVDGYVSTIEPSGCL